MSENEIFDILRQSLWAAIIISAPTLLTALAVGFFIGLLQALTSVQEMTLTFVPKALAMIGVIWITISPMTSILVDFFQKVLIPASLKF